MRPVFGDWMEGKVRSRVGHVGLYAGLMALVGSNLFAQGRWVYRYVGCPYDYGEAHAIVVGADSNLYVAGTTSGGPLGGGFSVVSLTLSGAERWVYSTGWGASQPRAYSIVVGLDGNLYAAGSSWSSSSLLDFTVASLKSSGEERWVYKYDGPAHGGDEARSIAVGKDGNLYVAGSGSGAIFSDMLVVSLTPSGSERWLYRYNGPADSSDGAFSIAVGADSHLYVAGYSWGNEGRSDFTVVSLTASGEERWVYRYNGPGNHWDEAICIAMGADGHPYLGGFSWGSGTSGDLVVVSLTSSGEERWFYRYRGPADSYDRADAITVSPDGHLYVAGFSGGRGTYRDLAVVGLTCSGQERWVYTYNGPANYDDEAESIVIGSDGNIYVAGRVHQTPFNDDFAVVSLAPSGRERWLYLYDGSGSDWDLANSITVGPDSNLYAAGRSWESQMSCHFTVIGLSRHSEYRIPPQYMKLGLSASPVPTSSGVRISYCLPAGAKVRLSIYDGLGRLVKTLVDAREEGGLRAVTWDTTNRNGTKVSTGTYFCRFTACPESGRGAGHFVATKKLSVLR